MAPPTPAPTKTEKRRMSVASVSKGIKKEGRRFAFYGPEGVGKTTFVADASNPVFFDLDLGSHWMANVPRMPGREDLGREVTYNDILDGVESLIRDDHNYKTVVFDTVDKLESIIWNHVNSRKHNDTKDSIEDWGFGKGYQYALDTWRDFCGRFLEDLRAKRGVDIVFIGHAIVKTFKNPDGDDYDRYQMRLHDKSAAFIKEYCDVVGFINYEVAIKRDDKAKRSRGAMTGARILHLARQAAWDAKSRFPTSDEMPLLWADFAKAIEDGKTGSVQSLRRQIDQLLEKFSPSWRETLSRRINECGEDTVRLSKAIDYMLGLIRDQERNE